MFWLTAWEGLTGAEAAERIPMQVANWDESISLWEAPPLDNEEPFARLQEKRRRCPDQRSSAWHLQEAELCLGYKNLSVVRCYLKHLQNEVLSVPLQARKVRLQAALEKIKP